MKTQTSSTVQGAEGFYNFGNGVASFVATGSKRVASALKTIYSHAGKRMVYEAYLRQNPEMAKKYLECVIKYPWAMYIKWDKGKSRFSAAL